MRAVIRVGRTCPTSLFSMLLAGALLFSLFSATRPPRPAAAAQDRRSQLTVNTALPPGQAAPGSLTLADALAATAANGRDDLITFDPTAFGDKPVTIRLKQSIARQGAKDGHDRIDASALRGGLTVDAADCPDAGLAIGGEARLTLANLTIQGGRQRVVLVKDKAQLTLEKVTVRESGGPGGALFGQAVLSMTGGRLADNHTHGLELHGSANAICSEVTFEGNRQSGAAGFDEAGLNATDCRFEGNGEWSLVLIDDSRANLVRSSLRGGKFANADFSGTASARLQECTVERGERFGIFATGRSSVELLGTTLRAHGSRGIELQDGANLKLDGSRVESNTDYGIILFGQSTISAARSAIGNNGAHGASLRGTASGRFVECSFIGNHFSGLGCLDAQNGGTVEASRCLFRQNGMRPLYRGPLHIDPLVPTPLAIHDTIVDCMADPGATVELFLDRAGEATRYIKTVRADNLGRFGVDCRDVPQGWVMTAAATVNGSTSEFNVVAGSTPEPVLNALLARTGPLSDDGGDVNLDMLLRHWKPGTHLVFAMDGTPSVAVERYIRYLVQRVGDWTSGAVSAELRIGASPGAAKGAIVIPVRYVSAESPQLVGRGGVTLMKWDASGYFLTPMEIMLATNKDPQENCPRVLAHEVGHALGLCHTRVGLLSRMQGSSPPSQAFVNDFSPMMTYYDVLALHLLHDPQNPPGVTLRKLIERGVVPRMPAREVAEIRTAAAEPSFSPLPETRPAAPTPRKARRR